MLCHLDSYYNELVEFFEKAKYDILYSSASHAMCKIAEEKVRKDSA
jgi:hypothetical protein